MANKAKYFNLKNKYKILKENKAKRKQSLEMRRDSEEAKRMPVDI